MTLNAISRLAPRSVATLRRILPVAMTAIVETKTAIAASAENDIMIIHPGKNE
jgi:hypothetical protein